MNFIDIGTSATIGKQPLLIFFSRLERFQCVAQRHTFSANVGYRALGVDYEDVGFVYDIIQHGPIAGVVIRF
jgi:hypothetical protein